MDVKKAVVPVAGLGTRFLPATKTIPKEMLTVVDRPTIQYIVEEVIPFIHSQCGGRVFTITTGASLGALHAANTFFRLPHLVDGTIAMSGSYDLKQYTKGYWDDNVYFNFPLCYLPNLRDPAYIDKFRESDIIICTGKGAWEEDSIKETKALEDNLKGLGVQAWIDYWGDDVNHDWPWWRKQLPYFLGHLDL